MAVRRALGFPWAVGRIESIRGKRAILFDQHGQRLEIRMDMRRGQLPRVGEIWMADRSLGVWTFAAIVEPKPPTVVGQVIDDRAERSLIDALAEIEVIKDNTETIPPPVVTGINAGPNPALRSLLNALDSLKIINDQTTDG